MHSKVKTVALLGRDTGVSLLKDVLLKHSKLELTQVFTHRKLPKAEGGGLRPEYYDFANICDKEQIPLTALEYPEALELEKFLPEAELNLLLVLSWKYKVSNNALSRFSYGGINIHRGHLPTYSGLYPVKRAILAGETKLGITAHKMIDEIDAGDIICQSSIDLKPRLPNETLEDYIGRMKDSLKPLYGPIAHLAIETMISHYKI